MFGKLFKSFNKEEIEALNKKLADNESKFKQELGTLKEELQKYKQDSSNSENTVKEYKTKLDETNQNLNKTLSKEAELLNELKNIKEENLKLIAEAKDYKSNLDLSLSKESDSNKQLEPLKTQLAKYELDFKNLENENEILKNRLKETQSNLQKSLLKEVEQNSEIINLKNKLAKVSDITTETPATTGTRTKKKILVVDDSSIMRNLQKNILESAQFEVSVAKNGIEGKEVLEKEMPDLVVTDVEMPQMNGLDLTKWIKSNYSKIPIIIVTSATSEEGKQRVIDAGPDSFIIKDEFNPKSFLSAVEKLVKK